MEEFEQEFQSYKFSGKRKRDAESEFSDEEDADESMAKVSRQTGFSPCKLQREGAHKFFIFKMNLNF